MRGGKNSKMKKKVLYYFNIVINRKIRGNFSFPQTQKYTFV